MSDTGHEHAARVFRLPDLGEGLVEAEIVDWLVDVGDEVTIDQPVAEVETAKTTVEVPCPYTGTVQTLHGEKGDVLQVAAPLLTVRVEGHAPAPQEQARALVGYGADTTLRRRRRRVSAAAARFGERTIPLRGADRTAAEQVTRSHREIPDATTWVEADATAFLTARSALRDGPGDAGVLALLAHGCVTALRDHPRLNARMGAGGTEIVETEAIHLGFAAQTAHALMVPVIRDAQERGPAELDAEIRRLVTAARDGTLSPGELTGATFTLNNYGGYGVDGAVPIVPFPQAGILGAGRITRRPWVVGEQVVPRDVVRLSLTFDHRICSGATAGGFLRAVADFVECPHARLGLPEPTG